MTKLAVKIANENAEQRALVKWLSFNPVLKNFYCKIDNEGERKVIVKNGVKIPVGLFNACKMGLRPGANDLFIYYPTKKHHGLWLEMKRNKKYSRSERLTETWLAQERFQECVKSVGYAAFFCYGCGDAIRIIENYLLNN